MDLPQEIRTMIYESCFYDHDSEVRVWKRPVIAEDGETESLASSTTSWCWGILRLSTDIYHEAIAVAYSKNTFAIVESNTAFLPVSHNGWHYIRYMAIGQEAYPYTASVQVVDEYLPILKSNCSRLERLDIFIYADEMVQAIPCLTKWVASTPASIRPRLALNAAVTGDHEPDLEEAADLLNGKLGEPGMRNVGWTMSPYSVADWPGVSETVEHMPNARTIVFHTTDLSVGEEEVLDAYCAWGFHLEKFVHEQGSGRIRGEYTYTWQEVGKDDKVEQSDSHEA